MPLQRQRKKLLLGGNAGARRGARPEPPGLPGDAAASACYGLHDLSRPAAACNGIQSRNFSQNRNLLMTRCSWRTALNYYLAALMAWEYPKRLAGWSVPCALANGQHPRNRGCCHSTTRVVFTRASGYGSHTLSRVMSAARFFRFLRGIAP